MGRFFASVSTLWVLVLPLLSVTNLGIIDELSKTKGGTFGDTPPRTKIPDGMDDEDNFE